MTEEMFRRLYLELQMINCMKQKAPGAGEVTQWLRVSAVQTSGPGFKHPAPTQRVGHDVTCPGASETGALWTDSLTQMLSFQFSETEQDGERHLKNCSGFYMCTYGIVKSVHIHTLSYT